MSFNAENQFFITTRRVIVCEFKRVCYNMMFLVLLTDNVRNQKRILNSQNVNKLIFFLPKIVLTERRIIIRTKQDEE